MSKFRLKKITPGKMSRKNAFKIRVIKFVPFLKGFFCGAIIVGFYAMTQLSNVEIARTKEFIAFADPRRIVELARARQIIEEAHAQESEEIETVDVSSLVADLFGPDASEVYAVFKAESGLNPKAKGWNCYYYDARGARYSEACKKEDRSKAWSVDCGIAQNNFPGTECPDYSFDPIWSVREAHRKFTTKVNGKPRGFTPWTAWKKGLHIPFLNELAKAQKK